MGSRIKDPTCSHKLSSPLSLDGRFITPSIKKSKFCFPFMLIKQQEFPGGNADKPNCSQLESRGLVPVMRFLTLSFPVSLWSYREVSGLQGWVREIIKVFMIVMICPYSGKTVRCWLGFDNMVMINTRGLISGKRVGAEVWLCLGGGGFGESIKWDTGTAEEETSLPGVLQSSSTT